MKKLDKKYIQIDKLPLISDHCDDNLPPDITILSESNLHFLTTTEGNYIDDGATCKDPEDGVISNVVEVSGDVVNLSQSGTYTINYNCTDSCDENALTATRIVTVVACAADEDLDCNYNCFPLSWIGDGFCDNNSYSHQGNSIDLTCPAWNVDYGDCIEGCTDASAINFDPAAEVDDDSCEYTVYGCTDASAINFDPAANVDDNSCVFGCQNPIFGVYDAQDAAAVASDGWSPANLPILDNYWDDFITDHNDGGLAVIDEFNSGNCCFAFTDGSMLSISGTPYGFQFPASTNDGAINCNPADGHSDNLVFYRLDEHIDLANAVVTSTEACVFNHNPSVYFGCGGCIDPIADNYDPTATVNDDSCTYSNGGCTDPMADNYDPTATVNDDSCTYTCDNIEFGIYDATGQDDINDLGWEAIGLGELQYFWGDFVDDYEDGDGIAVIQTWESSNCCFALPYTEEEDFLVLTIDGTLYNYLFPASADNSIVCSPPDGYMQGEGYTFYNVSLNANNADDVGLASSCVAGNNPSIYHRCDNDELNGCTDVTACNYNPIATNDDGTCTYAAEYHDCAGNCLNDINLNSVCDDLEQVCFLPSDLANALGDLNIDGTLDVLDIVLLVNAILESADSDLDLWA